MFAHIPSNKSLLLSLNCVRANKSQICVPIYVDFTYPFLKYHYYLLLPNLMVLSIRLKGVWVTLWHPFFVLGKSNPSHEITSVNLTNSLVKQSILSLLLNFSIASNR